MKQYNNLEDIITFLYRHITTFKGASIVKDTTRLSKIKYDAYIDSTISAPLSFTVFELSDKGELLIDNASRIIESEAAFFLFVNSCHGWTFAVKNTLENQKKLIKQEQIQNYKIKFL
ncbi:TPA: hypothetical protein IAA87_08840 [Candidatus Avigastranaerophilus faecigallinarum]|nr:hypothetical protein [Candidatus Avigastranaerophilus faecigallinarum]